MVFVQLLGLVVSFPLELSYDHVNCGKTAVKLVMPWPPSWKMDMASQLLRIVRFGWNLIGRCSMTCR